MATIAPGTPSVYQHKHKVYIDYEDQAPYGVNVHRGPAGGLYYFSNEKPAAAPKKDEDPGDDKGYKSKPVDRPKVKDIDRETKYQSTKDFLDSITKMYNNDQLKGFFKDRKLTPRGVKACIDKGYELDSLYKHQKLTPDMIDYAIKNGKSLKNCVLYQQLADKQLEQAFEKLKQAGDEQSIKDIIAREVKNDAFKQLQKKYKGVNGNISERFSGLLSNFKEFDPYEDRVYVDIDGGEKAPSGVLVIPGPRGGWYYMRTDPALQKHLQKEPDETPKDVVMPIEEPEKGAKDSDSGEKEPEYEPIEPKNDIKGPTEKEPKEPKKEPKEPKGYEKDIKDGYYKGSKMSITEVDDKLQEMSVFEHDDDDWDYEFSIFTNDIENNKVKLTPEQLDFFIDNVSHDTFLANSLLETHKFSDEQAKKLIDYYDDNNDMLVTLFKNQKLSESTIDDLTNNDKYLGYIYSFQKLTDEQITKAIIKGQGLSRLYDNQKLKKHHIDMAIPHSDKNSLFILYTKQKLGPEMLDAAIDRGTYLNTLFEYQTFSEEQIDRIINDGISLEGLCKHIKLNEEQIKKIIGGGPVETGAFHNLFVHQKLTPEVIDIGLQNDYYSTIIYKYQKMTDKQISDELSKGGIEKHLIIKHQDLTEEHIKDIIKQKKPFLLEVLFKDRKLNEEQINLVIDNDVITKDLFITQDFTSSNTDKIISKIYDKENYEALSYLFKTQKLTPDQIDIALEKGHKLHELYRHQDLSINQVKKALEVDDYLDVLFFNQEIPQEDISNLIKNDKNLLELYKDQVFSDDNINLAIEKGDYLYILYSHQKMSPESIDKAIINGDALDTLFQHQKLSLENIENAISNGERLDALFRHQDLSEQQVNKIIEDGEHILALIYRSYNFSKEQVDTILDKTNLESGVFNSMYFRRKLTDDQIEKAIKNELDLEALYHTQNLSFKNIDLALDKGKYLGTLYDEKNRLSEEQIDRAIDIGETLNILYVNQKMTPKNIDKAISNGRNLDLLYDNQKLSSENIDNAIDKGENLHRVYQHFVLSPEQITKGINKVVDYRSIQMFQKLTKEHIDLIIEKRQATVTLFDKYTLDEDQVSKTIDSIYNGPVSQFDRMYSLLRTQKLSDKNINFVLDICDHKNVGEEKSYLLNALYESTAVSTKNKQIIERLDNLVKKRLPKELQDFELNKFTLNKKTLERAKKLYDAGISKQISEKPLSTIVGKYKVNTSTNTSNSFFKDKKEIVNGRRETLVSKDDYEIITEYLSKKNYKLDDNDSRYAHNIDTGRKMSVGRLLSGKSGDKELLKRYNIIRQFEDKEGTDVEMYISMDPIDIIRKSTAQNWGSCETVGSGSDDGIISDIESNNAIAYLVKGGNKHRWLGRVMIRWGHDKNGEPNAVVEKYYGDVSYNKLLRDNAIDVLRKNGYSGRIGYDERIKLPVRYRGFVDSGTNVSYKASSRPTQKEIDALTKRIVKLERLLRIRQQLIERAIKYNKINMKENIDDEFYVLGRDIPRTVLNKEQEQRLLKILYNTFDNEPELKSEEIEMDDGKKTNVLEFLKKQIDEYESRKSLGHSKRIQKLKEDFHTQDLKKYIQEMFDMGYSKNIIAIKSKQRFPEISMAYIENMIDRCFDEHTDKVVEEIEPVTLDDIAEHEYKEKYEQLNGIRRMNVDNVYKNLHNMPKKFRYKLERLYKKVK